MANTCYLPEPQLVLELPPHRPEAPLVAAELVESPEANPWKNRPGRRFKKDYQKYLYVLQNGFCAYCENPIPENSNDPRAPAPGRSRIDHVKPQSQHPDLRYTPSNLVLSCNRDSSQHLDIHCDAAKSDQLLPIEPGPGCNDGWVMLTDGKIVARHSSSQHNRDLNETARVLNLNSARLTNSRREDAESLFSVLNDNTIPVEMRQGMLQVLLSQVGGRNYVKTVLPQ